MFAILAVIIVIGLEHLTREAREFLLPGLTFAINRFSDFRANAAKYNIFFITYI